MTKREQIIEILVKHNIDYLYPAMEKVIDELAQLQSEQDSKDELRDIILTFEKWVLSHEHIIRDYETPEQVADEYLKTR